MLALLLVLGGGRMAGAEDLVIPGLGKLPLGNGITVTDGKDNEIGRFFQETAHRKGYGKTARAAMWNMLAVPPGVNMHPQHPPYPYDSMHLYQLRSENMKGLYTAAVFVFSGTEKDFFHEGNRKAASFWRKAFHEDADRPTSLFGMSKIRIEEFQEIMDNLLKGKEGGARSVKLMTFSPWHAFKNGDGTYRWSQEVRAVVTNEKGLSFPLWIYTSFYKEKDRYYLIEVNGSHESAEKIGDRLVYGLYRMERNQE